MNGRLLWYTLPLIPQSDRHQFGTIALSLALETLETVPNRGRRTDIRFLFCYLNISCILNFVVILEKI